MPNSYVDKGGRGRGRPRPKNQFGENEKGESFASCRGTTRVDGQTDGRTISVSALIMRGTAILLAAVAVWTKTLFGYRRRYRTP